MSDSPLTSRGRWPRWLTYANYAMASLFAASAALQHNDPDPWPWILLYGAASLACVQHGRWSRDRLAELAVLVIAAAWLGYLVPGVLEQAQIRDLFKSMDDKGGAAELAREAGGLVITAGWMIVLLWPRGRR